MERCGVLDIEGRVVLHELSQALDFAVEDEEPCVWGPFRRGDRFEEDGRGGCLGVERLPEDDGCGRENDVRDTLCSFLSELVYPAFPEERRDFQLDMSRSILKEVFLIFQFIRNLSEKSIYESCFRDGIAFFRKVDGYIDDGIRFCPVKVQDLGKRPPEDLFDARSDFSRCVVCD